MTKKHQDILSPTLTIRNLCIASIILCSMIRPVAAQSMLPAGYLSTSGSQTVDRAHNPVRIASVGWFENYDNLPTQLAKIKATGFNCVRIPWQNATYPGQLATFDKIVAAAGTAGVKVIFDHHFDEIGGPKNGWGAQQCNGLPIDSGPGTDGTDGCKDGITGAVTIQKFISDWVVFAKHYKGNSTVIGYDLDNEPLHYGGQSTWGDGGPTDLRKIYQDTGNAIQAVEPRVLIICEGPQCYGSNFAGNKLGAPYGDLSFVPQYPVELTVPHKVVYSVHIYPRTISGFRGPETGPDAIARMNADFGLVFSQNIAPVWIGEIGARMNTQAERDWGRATAEYLNGKAPGGITLTGNQQGMGTSWWMWGSEDAQQPNGVSDHNGNPRPEQKAIWATFLYKAAKRHGGAARLIKGPLAGPVTKGVWEYGDTPFPGMARGAMHYAMLLPSGYSPNNSYPILVYEHENTEGNRWYRSAGDPARNTIVNQLEIDRTFNTVAFRTNYPAIVIAPFCDQTDGSGGSSGQNFGGYNDNGATNVNERALVAVVEDVMANYSVYPRKIYITGDSLGGIGTEGEMLDFNAVNGPQGRLFTAGLPFAGKVFRTPNPTQDPATVARLREVPMFMVSGSNDTTCSPNDFNRPLWKALTGDSNYPEPMGAAAGKSRVLYMEDRKLGHNVWGYYRQLAADGGHGDALYQWLFAQTSPSDASPELVEMNAPGDAPASRLASGFNNPGRR